jgi:peptide/nickel transport system substrate-binding protein
MKSFAVSSIAILLAAIVGGVRSFAQEAPTPRGEIRIVDKNPNNWSSMTFNVFEHLMEIDSDGALVPRLATGWRWLDARTLEVTLRQGVKFHNGEVFNAEVVKLNFEENIKFRQPHMIGTFMNFQAGSQLEIIDAQTVRFLFPEPDGGALAKLTQMHIGGRILSAGQAVGAGGLGS